MNKIRNDRIAELRMELSELELQEKIDNRIRKVVGKMLVEQKFKVVLAKIKADLKDN